MNAVFLALCNNSDAFKQRNLLCPKFYGRNSHSSDIYLNKPQSIRIIKIGFDYILSIFIICWLILNFGLNSFCSHRIVPTASSAHSIILFILCWALSCLHVCVCVSTTFTQIVRSSTYVACPNVFHFQNSHAFFSRCNIDFRSLIMRLWVR